eukprot:TRINITY_DN4900_c0_g1_i1.p1 TRINITY_DN4900_c0_g1~~TRINITY_DN4900_c0_g1_i1.p1  ORF type:complete len:1052 (-),score=235.14 TRINITY_DN4900_c0_g1_i1:403-3558(-)
MVQRISTPSGPGRPALSLALLILLVSPAWSDPEAIHVAPIYANSGDIAELPNVPITTKTVFGFLDFITTVSNTVMVFTSQGGPGNTPILNDRIPVSQKLDKLNIEPTAALELESIFNSLENERKHQPFIEVQSSKHDAAQSTKIQPSAVKKTEINEGVTHLQNGVLEIDGAEDEVIYDKFSAEPSLSVEETYRVKSTLATPVVTQTSVSSSQHVSETENKKPKQNDSGENSIDDEDSNGLDSEQEENLANARGSINTIRGRVKSNARQSASSAYKERLKKRLEKEKNKLTLKSLSAKSKGSNRRSFNPSKEKDVSYHNDEDESQTQRPTASRFKSRVSRTRSRSSGRSLESDEVFEEHVEEEVEEKSGRSTTGFGSRSRNRPTRQRPSFRRNTNKIRDSISSNRESSESRPTSFKPSRSSLGSRNRFSSRITQRTQTVSPSSVISVKPTPSKKNNFSPQTKSNAPKIEFKKFDRFDRPNLRKNLLNKFFSKRPRPNNKPTSVNESIDEVNEEEGDLAFPDDHESSPSAFVTSIIDDEDILQNLDNDEIRMERLQTTLLVSTVYPEESSEEYLEVATIRSPYTFNIEDNQKSTRFITVTRTFSKTIDITPSSSFTSAISIITPSSSIKPSSPVSSTPLFDTKSIPAPENILASTATPYKAIIEGSSNIETLSPLTLASSLHHATPPLKTVTESLSTVETIIKKSILPVIFGEDTSFYTLSQTYTVTRIVTAVKTIPPMELYEFSPENSFADFDNLFEEAGSENRESLLPGELEFSDQDNFGLEGPSEIRVAPPQGFLEDLDLIGAKLDFVNHMEKHNNPEIMQLKNTPTIDSSFGQSNPSFGNINQISPTKTQATPALPDLGGLAGLGVTPEQLLYLQLLQNPLAALGIGGGLQPQVITESSPIYKTEPVIQTSVIKLFLGAKEFYTTLTQTNGVTTKTDYVYSTRTVSGGLGGLSGLLGGFGQIGGAQQVAQQPAQGLGGILPSYTVVSSPVTRDTVITQIITEEYKLRFRNQPTLTTVTSTKLVSTQVVSFVTKTQRVVPSANPLAGLLG